VHVGANRRKPRVANEEREDKEEGEVAGYRWSVAQNIYDDDSFFAGYSTLPRSVHGLDGAPEWPSLRELLPDLRGRQVLDLGCGYGWFSRWAVENGAGHVLGIDLSERMLATAKSKTGTTVITYQQHDLEHVVLEADAFDVVYSSLTLHYLEALPALLRQVHGALRTGGAFVFSVEHPLFTAPTNPGFVTSPDGTLTWPVDRYLIEGPRVTNWFAPGVVKQHRTIGTYVNLLIATGFHIDALIEWGPTPEQIAAVPAWAGETDRPAFLLMRAHRS
jgi:SAM-dependent methyltransferase